MEKEREMSFFKAYDMRGTFGTDFDLDVVWRIGRALPDVVARGRWLVGRDARASSPAVRDALVAGLSAAGVEVVDIGLATTPMVYFFTAEDGFDGSVMITASHNPPSDNGLKVSRKGAVPVGLSSGLAEVERIVAAMPKGSWSGSGAHGADATTPDLLHRYCSWLRSHSGGTLEGLRFAVDCSDGMASLIAHDLFPGAVFLNDVPDGTFPHHAPNPLLADARAQLAECVHSNGLDCGVIFDGDADRCMFVDETGAFIQPDYLIPVLAGTFAEKGKVIHDVRTSRAAIEAIRGMGLEPVMGKVGHAFAKMLLRETGAVCGGELAGHYYFRDFHFCDSGELAALRILSAFAAARRRGTKVSELLAPITRKYANSGEMNFKVSDKPAAIARVLAAAEKFGREVSRETMDGVRVEFDEGWISVRQSNTEPYLRLLAECDTSARLEAWTKSMKAAVAET